MTATKLINQCKQLGIRLEPSGSALQVKGAQKASPELIEELRRHKLEIIATLESKRKGSWLHVAWQVLCGEFTGCDSSTRKNLTIGLRSINHPRCREALKVLNK